DVALDYEARGARQFRSVFHYRFHDLLNFYGAPIIADLPFLGGGEKQNLVDHSVICRVWFLITTPYLVSCSFPSTTPSAILLAAEPITAKGVRNPWDTEATKSICNLASCTSLIILL